MSSPLLSEGCKLSFKTSGTINQGDVVYLVEPGKVKQANWASRASGLGIAFMSGSEGGLITIITHGHCEANITGTVNPMDPLIPSGSGKLAALGKITVTGTAPYTSEGNNGVILSRAVMAYALGSGSNKKLEILLIR